MAAKSATIEFQPASPPRERECHAVATGLRKRLRGGVERLERWVFYRLSRGVKEQRLRRFQQVMKPQPGELVLDIGAGGGDFWRAAGPATTQSMRMVALDRHPHMPGDLYHWRVIGDARFLPFRDQAFGIVFSNSVLEHVGGPAEQQKMAGEVQRVGTRHFAQVPSRWFPIEAHFFLPFLSYLPVRWQVRVTHFLFGFDEEIHLPSRQQAQRLFPASVIETERFWGCAKAYWIYRA